VRFQETILCGACIIDIEPREDDRGFFARTWCRDEFAAHGINKDWVQCSLSYNHRHGTLRGLHYQVGPHAEAKLIRCTAGAIFDVIVDLRQGSPDYGRWISFELTASNGRMLYVPEGLAHGFQTLMDDTQVFYQISESYQAEAAQGVRWNDPLLKIHWPECGERFISSRDRSFADLQPCQES
jgi:dTDP-4-dehydrorhamnose 3,5-epimerase